MNENNEDMEKRFISINYLMLIILFFGLIFTDYIIFIKHYDASDYIVNIPIIIGNIVLLIVYLFYLRNIWLYIRYNKSRIIMWVESYKLLKKRKIDFKEVKTILIITKDENYHNSVLTKSIGYEFYGNQKRIIMKFPPQGLHKLIRRDHKAKIKLVDELDLT